MPFLSLLSFLRSETPASFLSCTSDAIFSIILSIDAWYGSSFTTIADRPFPSSSISATALSFMDPRPFNIASFIDGVSTIRPPVGKSGPLIIFK